jgi:hypothetical protein
MRSGSFCSTIRCTTVGHWEAGIPYAGRFGPGHRCLITTGGVLPSAVSSSASRRCTLRYSFPDGARKREKIGDRGADGVSAPVRVFIHFSSNTRALVLSHRRLLARLALLYLRSHTCSSIINYWFIFCILTQH